VLNYDISEIAVVEQDHRLIKRVMKPKLGFKNYQSANATISGIEIMHMIRKHQAGSMTPYEEVGFINSVMNVG